MINILRHLHSNDRIGPVYENRKSSSMQTDYQTKWKIFCKEIHTFFMQEFQTSWERETGLPWRERVK
jgi:hypothetical protein